MLIAFSLMLLIECLKVDCRIMRERNRAADLAAFLAYELMNYWCFIFHSIIFY